MSTAADTSNAMGMLRKIAESDGGEAKISDFDEPDASIVDDLNRLNLVDVTHAGKVRAVKLTITGRLFLVMQKRIDVLERMVRG